MGKRTNHYKEEPPEEAGDPFPDEPVIPEGCAYSSATKLKEMVDSDLKICNMVVAYHLEGWSRVKSVRDVLSLTTSTMEVLTKRRELSLKPQSYDQVLKKKALNAKQNAPKLGTADADRMLTYEPLE